MIILTESNVLDNFIDDTYKITIMNSVIESERAKNEVCPYLKKSGDFHYSCSKLIEINTGQAIPTDTQIHDAWQKVSKLETHCMSGCYEKCETYKLE